jgi:hypothetical protein
MADHLRGRGIALNSAVFYGCLAGGSLMWGSVATGIGVTNTLLTASGLGLLALIPAARLPLASPQYATSR